MTLSANLVYLGVNAVKWTDKECLAQIETVLRTNKVILVIDDAQLLHPDSLLIQLVKRYGGFVHLPFPIYITVSVYSTYQTNLLPRVEHATEEFWFGYPNANTIRNLTSHLKLDYNLTMRLVGPSLRFINRYANNNQSVASSCNHALGTITHLESVCRNSILKVLKNTTSDWDSFMRDDYMNSNCLNLLIENHIFTSSITRFSWYTPLARRAACTFFESISKPIESCRAVANCDEIAL
ncbi:hypothetical protein GEMRC1_014202 [Eukaryota sp. GEM-RC1]